MTKPLPITEEELVRLYFIRDTAADIAKRKNVRPSWLLDQWDKLRLEGKLPPGSRTNAMMTKLRENETLDGLPKVGAYGDDPLLERLWDIHHAPPGKPDYDPGL